MYIAEIAPARLRGALGASNQLAITFGLLVSFVLGVVCHWKWLALIGAILPVLLVILMFNMPETPRWSLGKNRRTETLNALLWLRGPEVDIVEELTAIESSPGTHTFLLQGKSGGVFTKVLCGKAPPRGLTHLFIFHFWQKRYPFRILSIDKCSGRSRGGAGVLAPPPPTTPYC